MLKVSKTININGTSEIEGVQVAYMSASISTDGNNASINKNITNQDLYNANKVEVRKDMSDFEDVVYATEDELIKDAIVQSEKVRKVGK